MRPKEGQIGIEVLLSLVLLFASAGAQGNYLLSWRWYSSAATSLCWSEGAIACFWGVQDRRKPNIVAFVAMSIMDSTYP